VDGEIQSSQPSLLSLAEDSMRGIYQDKLNE
jgi:hypothetical protein